MKVCVKIYNDGLVCIFYKDRFGYLNKIKNEYYEKYITTDPVRSIVIKNKDVYVNGNLTNNKNAYKYVRCSVDDDIYATNIS